MKTDDLVDFEWRLLEAIVQKRNITWGATVSVGLEVLEGHGLVEREGMKFRATDEGVKAVEEWRKKG